MITDEQAATAAGIARSMTKGLANIEPSVRVMGLALYIAADIASQASDEEDAVIKFEAFAGMASAQINSMMKERGE